MSENKWCVYMHTNNGNGKRYIGITSQCPEKRWMGGFGYSEKLPFGRAVRKYGWENFEHRVLLSNLSEPEAKCLEDYLISILNTQDNRFGYNLTCGGDGVCGFHHSNESREKMSEAKTGRKHPNFGKHLPVTTCKKISMRLMGNTNCSGVTRTKETKEKMSMAKQKPVAMFVDNNAAAIKIFDSAKEAEALTGISRKNISLCCLGQRKHAGGYAWKFA